MGSDTTAVTALRPFPDAFGLPASTSRSWQRLPKQNGKAEIVNLSKENIYSSCCGTFRGGKLASKVLMSWTSVRSEKAVPMKANPKG